MTKKKLIELATPFLPDPHSIPEKYNKLHQLTDNLQCQIIFWGKEESRNLPDMVECGFFYYPNPQKNIQHIAYAEYNLPDGKWRWV